MLGFGEEVCAVFFDIQKAFDTIAHHTVDAAWNLLNYVLQSRGFYLLNIYMWACIFNSDMWFTDCSYTTQKQLHVYHQSTLLHHFHLHGMGAFSCRVPLFVWVIINVMWLL